MANKTLAPDDLALAEERGAQPRVHHKLEDLSDRFAVGFSKLLRFTADPSSFAMRNGHRAIMLETVAADPGIVGAMFTHLTGLRWMKDDEGWIRTAKNSLVPIRPPIWRLRSQFLTHCRRSRTCPV